MKRRIYISGKMTGIKDLNRRSFKTAYFKLLEPGVKVINPHDISYALRFLEILPDKISYPIYLFVDILVLLFCNEIYMLEGWEGSNGATIEFKVARFFDYKIDYEDKINEQSNIS